ncbi:MAG: L-serine ammonia-lyase, iron-sulfur-dependent, subunit alpha [Thermoanaerobacteraceae bacterium]|nr:L-serine ammonia-lyase, iron-sulfur-dependent, subunit alpha [Thermoanaerobacteraceae bacterium]
MDFIRVLKEQVVPSLGCTEPAAVGLAAAWARSVADGKIQNMEVYVSRNVLKNGSGVGIPNAKGRGIGLAAALGAIGGNKDAALEVFKYINESDEEEARDLLRGKKIKVSVKRDVPSLYVEVKITTDMVEGQAILSGSHTNLVSLTRDGVEMIKPADNSGPGAGLASIKDSSLKEIYEFVNSVDAGELEFLLEGIRINEEAAQYGLKEMCGAGIGRNVEKRIKTGIIPDNVENYAKMLTCAACDARMSGGRIAVMSSAGSGNHGLMTFLPIAAYCEKNNIDKARELKALAMSNLITVYIKEYSGRLSSICGCAIAAATGASCALCYLMGGSFENICLAINNMIGDMAGMICDGGKEGCSFKLLTSIDAAFDNAYLAMEGVSIPEYNGIVAKDAETTIKNLGRISIEGMSTAEDVVIDIMEKVND